MGWILRYPHIMHLMALTLIDVLCVYAADTEFLVNVAEIKCTATVKTNQIPHIKI